MTNFLYEMQNELIRLRMSVSFEAGKVINKLIDHIEAQGKQLRELNKAIVKKNETIAKCENKMNDQRMYIHNLVKKIDELNDGIRDSEDLSWKQKYYLSMRLLEERCRDAEKALEKEKQANKDLNAIINNKNDLLDRYMLKCNNLERNYDEEVKMKEQFKTACFRHETTIANQKATIEGLKGKLASIYQLANRINDVLTSKE